MAGEGMIGGAIIFIMVLAVPYCVILYGMFNADDHRVVAKGHFAASIVYGIIVLALILDIVLSCGREPFLCTRMAGVVFFSLLGLVMGYHIIRGILDLRLAAKNFKPIIRV